MRIKFTYKTKEGTDSVTGEFLSESKEECIKQFKDVHPECIELISAENAKIYEIKSNQVTWSIRIEILEDQSRSHIRAMVEFWTDWEYRLASNDGDYTITFLQFIARDIFKLIINEDLSLNQLRKYFDDAEGYCPINGSYGIDIVDFDDYEIEAADFDVVDF